MKKILLKNKKYVCLALIIAIAFNFTFIPATALAADVGAVKAGQTGPAATDPSSAGGMIGWIAGKTLLFASSAISAIFGAFFGLILYVEAKIIDFILSPDYFSFTNAPIVQIGWTVTRDLGNMFFILILLMIAFATVLRIESYGMRQLLPRLVIAALLVNFSLVFAGFFIDLSQVLTVFFIKQGIGSDFGTITTKLASNMMIINFYNPSAPDSTLAGITQFGSSAIAALLGIILSLVGMVVTVFVFGATAVFLVARIINIWWLLIALPITIVISIVQPGRFQKWWESFFKWVSFAPVYTFFIYISLQIFDGTGRLMDGVFRGSVPAGWNTAAAGLTTGFMPAAIFQWILVIGFMVYALIYAQSAGVEGSKAAYGMLKGWGEGAKAWTGRELRRRALSLGAQPATETAPAKPGFLIRRAQQIAALPGGRLLTGQVFKMAGAEAKTVEEAKGQFSNWTPEAIQAYLKTPGMFPNLQMGAALALKDQGKLEKLGEPRIRELAAVASRQYPKQLDEILKVAPHLATSFNKKMKDVAAKIEKASETMLESLADSEVVMNFNPEQFKDLARKGGDVKMKRVKDVVKREYTLLQQRDPALAREVDTIVGGKLKEEDRNRKLGELTAKNEQVGKLARAIFSTRSPAWEI